MFEEQKDQRQFLRNKIKLLQQEIVQRTRNFMITSQLRSNQIPNNYPPPIITSQKHSQTDPIHIKPIHHIQNNNTNQQVQLYEWYGVFRRDWQNSVQDLSQQIDKMKKREKIKQGQHIEGLKQISLSKIINDRSKNRIDILNQLVVFLSSDKELENSRLIKIFNLLRKNQLEYQAQLLEYVENKNIGMEREKQQKYNGDEQGKNRMEMNDEMQSLQKGWEVITKMLNESQERNYQLRLQLQQKQIKYRQQEQKNSRNRIQLQNNSRIISEMRDKLQKMQIVKKQYLRAYTKVKQEKQEIQIKYIDLQEQLHKINNLKDKQSRPETFDSNFTISEDQDIRLKTIIEHSEDQIIEEVVRNTSSANSLEAIRQIIQHGLMETNRSTSQKWIKSALIKLEQYENQREQQEQKRIQSQTNLQISVHQKYRTIFNNIMKANMKQKKLMQQNFNQALSKMIADFQKAKKQEHSLQASKQFPDFTRKNTPKLARLESDFYSFKEQKQSPEQLQQNSKCSQILQLTLKLNQSQQQYSQLKKKYDSLLLQKKQQEEKIFVIKNERSNENFHAFMEKLVKNQQKIFHQSSDLKFTQQLFHQISNRVFQILCHFPIGDHGKVFFVPNSIHELQQALEVIYNFSLSFDHQQENKLEQFKKQAKNLTKVLQEIAVAKEVPTQMMIQSVKNNLKDQNSLTEVYVKTMIKKLSEENEIKKKKPIQNLMTQIQFQYEQL